MKSAGRVDRILKDALQEESLWLTQKSLDYLFSHKKITGNSGRAVKAGDTVQVGEVISIEFPSEHLGILAANLEQEALKEKLLTLEASQDFLLWNKKEGIPSVPHYPWENSTALNEIVAYLESQNLLSGMQELFESPSFDLGLVQRLDTDTSGALLFALTKQAKLSFRKYFSEHKFEKIYWAIVCGDYSQAQKNFTFYLDVKNPKKVRATLAGKEGGSVEKVSLIIHCLARTEKVSLLELKTCFGGRHIVRAVTQFLGFPLLGDRLYGDAENKKLGWEGEQHFLHARELRLLDKGSPFSKLEVGYKAEAPESFIKCLKEMHLND